MSEYHFKQFYERGTRIVVKKNNILFTPDDADSESFVFLLESGLAALSSLTKDGEEKIYLYFTPKRLVGFNQFFRTPLFTMPIYITAKEQCVVYRLHGEIFQRLLKEDGEFMDYVMKLNAKNYMEVLGRFHEMQEESACTRLCRLLLNYAVNEGEKKKLPRYFTSAEIAKFLGVHQVTVNRIMAKLKKYEYIGNDKHTRHIVIQNEIGLQNLVQAGINIEY